MKKFLMACMACIVLGLIVLSVCVSCSNVKAPAPEETTLPALLEQAKGEIDYENSDIEATLLTIGTRQQGWGGASVSVAYILLRNDSVLIVAPQYTKPPFTKDEARLLMKSKIKGEMLLFD